MPAPDYTAEKAHLNRLLNTGLSGNQMIDGNIVFLDPKAIRLRLRELIAMEGGGDVSGPVGLDLSAIGGRAST